MFTSIYDTYDVSVPHGGEAVRYDHGRSVFGSRFQGVLDNLAKENSNLKYINFLFLYLVSI